jgi:hypothetical protein
LLSSSLFRVRSFTFSFCLLRQKKSTEKSEGFSCGFHSPPTPQIQTERAFSLLKIRSYRGIFLSFMLVFLLIQHCFLPFHAFSHFREFFETVDDVRLVKMENFLLLSLCVMLKEAQVFVLCLLVASLQSFLEENVDDDGGKKRERSGL